MYKIYLPRIFILIFLITSSACVTRQDKDLFTDYPEQMTRFSIVSMSAPGFAVPHGSSVSFHPQMFNHAAPKDPAIAETRALLNDVIQQSLQDRNLPFSPYVRARGDYLLAYTFVGQHSMTDDQITRQFGMTPGFMQGEATQYEKGTLVLDLIDANKQKTVWRSSIQGLVAPDLEENLRRIRLRSAFDQVFGSLPLESKR